MGRNEWECASERVKAPSPGRITSSIPRGWKRGKGTKWCTPGVMLPRCWGTGILLFRVHSLGNAVKEAAFWLNKKHDLVNNVANFTWKSNYYSWAKSIVRKFSPSNRFFSLTPIMYKRSQFPAVSALSSLDEAREHVKWGEFILDRAGSAPRLPVCWCCCARTSGNQRRGGRVTRTIEETADSQRRRESGRNGESANDGTDTVIDKAAQGTIIRGNDRWGEVVERRGNCAEMTDEFISSTIFRIHTLWSNGEKNTLKLIGTNSLLVVITGKWSTQLRAILARWSR